MRLTVDKGDPMGDGDQTSPEPQTLQEKINYLLDETFPDKRPSDREFSRMVEARGASLSYSYFGKLRKGEVDSTVVSDDILKALGLGFGVDWRFFKDESDVAHDAVAALEFLAKKRSGDIAGIAGRGLSDHGLTPELLDFALSLFDEAKAKHESRGANPDAK
ncbi:hypothetical protein [Streptomyces sp. NPDC001404]|uniref:hypothetical protein n=1 Tax=Streptomyces sp. NPDC001404 TaxID=3364571 RepID=UPI0036B04636